MNIIAYTWESGVQCIHCTKQARDARILNPHAWSNHGGTDNNGLREDLHGRDGGRVRPVFSTDEKPDAGLYCDTCGDEIVAPTPERFVA